MAKDKIKKMKISDGILNTVTNDAQVGNYAWYMRLL